MSYMRTVGLTALLMGVVAGVDATTVGEMHRTTTTPTVALRDAAHSDRLAITVWYPAVDDAKETPLDIGAPGKPLFHSGSAAADAAMAPGRHPVVLLSHGFGGSARMMGWFGTALARAGYVVVAVDHPGNNGTGPITLPGAALWWERAEDLKAAWTAVRKDEGIAAHIESARLGVAGFSAGGFTALVAAGARADVPHYIAFCHAHPDDGVCRPQKEAPEITGQTREHVFDDPVLKAQLVHADESHAVPGIKAVFAMSPALVQAIAPASFANIRVPVRFVVGSADIVAAPKTNADVAVAAIAGARLTSLPGVGHYDFLGLCTEAGRAEVPQCAIAQPQEPTHARAIAEATALFKASL